MGYKGVMNRLAEELNQTLSDSIAYGFLSPLGRRMYFPKGIVAQSDEAKEKAKRYNATVGLATRKGEPFYLQDIYTAFKDGIFKPSQIFSYAPGGGDKTLRALWKESMIQKNPHLKGKKTSLPVVTSGLTHAISLAAEMFVGEGDSVVCPDLFWDNYDLIFSDLIGAKPVLFPFYGEHGGFNVEGMKNALMSVESEYVRIILNFPNNPTGYTPSKMEAKEMVAALISVADSGKKILVLSDDAYFGLFFEEETEKESLFAYLADAHENIFAVKGDAATKEEMVWGFRIGFITYASKGFTDAHLDALTKKTLGMIRCTVSNCDRPGQSLVVNAIQNGTHYAEDKETIFKAMDERYRIVKKAVERHKDEKIITPYAFNSGYFMAFSTNGRNAEDLRVYLLDKYQIGAINIMGHTLRLAYCSVEPEGLDEVVDTVYKAAEELWS